MSKIYLSIPHLGNGELDAIKHVFQNNWISTEGPEIKLFEDKLEKIVGKPAIAMNSGTSALHLAMKAVGVSEGDEVIIPSLNFVSAANCVLYCGATPVFIDSENISCGLDPNFLSEELKRRSLNNDLPKAVCVVHLFGHSVQLGEIGSICKKYGTTLIEDAANSLGTHYQGEQVGKFSDISIVSFGGNKIVTTSTGGAVFSNNNDWMEKIQFWSRQSKDPDPEGIGNYYHSEVGYNYRISNVLAGIGLAQLDVLENRVQQRRKVFEYYDNQFFNLPGIMPQPEAKWTRHNRWLSIFLVDENKFGKSVPEIIRFLANRNIESRPVWKPLHTQKLFSGCQMIGGEVAEDLHKRGICLPSSSCLTEEELNRVVKAVCDCHKQSF